MRHLGAGPLYGQKSPNPKLRPSGISRDARLLLHFVLSPTLTLLSDKNLSYTIFRSPRGKNQRKATEDNFEDKSKTMFALRSKGNCKTLN